MPVSLLSQGFKGKDKGKGKWGAGKGHDDHPPPPSAAGLSRPDPQWPGGCWHCGKRHARGRTQCSEFRKLIRQHKGLPINYAGAYERWARKNKPATALVNVFAEAHTDAEHVIAALAEAEPGPSAPSQAEQAPHEHPETMKPRQIFALLDHESAFADKTEWQTLANNDDDYSDLMTSLSQITGNILIGPTLPQRSRKAARLTPQRIAAIAKAIDDGQITLPELDLPSDKDYVAVWA